jgi:hypothetical protein
MRNKNKPKVPNNQIRDKKDPIPILISFKGAQGRPDNIASQSEVNY